MKTWTTQAESRLEAYLASRAAREGLHGEEAAELISDLRQHIHEEAGRLESERIGRMELEGILSQMDAGERLEPAPPVPPASPSGPSAPTAPNAAIPARTRAAADRWPGKWWAWLTGVVFPLVVIGVEVSIHFCGGVFFDPVPDLWHGLLLLLVPLVNAGFLTGRLEVGPRWQGGLAGLALAVAVFYGLLFLPLVPMSVIMLAFFGIGLLSLTPVLAAWQTWRIACRVRDRIADMHAFSRWARRTAMATFLTLLAAEGPALWTRFQLQMAVDDPAPNPAAIARLRTFHTEDTLLKACYEGPRGTQQGTDLSGWMMTSWRIPLAMIDASLWRPASPEKVRDVFFRVTGKPFNAVPPPRVRTGMGRAFDPLQEVDFDSHTGGDEVAVRIRGLDLAESRFDGHADAVSQIGYGEWTMVFRNAATLPREARCQVRLPAGGRVSRLTLWINGEPQEAAFSTVAKVKAAYREVVVVQRRDPVLVTMVAPDTVMVQCFPVPARGEMKIRFGITAPLDGKTWELPRLIERNFGFSPGLSHALWLQGNHKFQLLGGSATLTANPDGPGQSLAASLGPESLTRDPLRWVVEERPAPPAPVWCVDPHAPESGRILIRESATAASAPEPAKAVIVIDGSAALGPEKNRILQWLDKSPAERLIVLLADDSARRVTLQELAAFRFSGGRNNEPALTEAIRIARAEGGVPVLWLHGPQPVKLAGAEALNQLLERGGRLPRIAACSIAPGPNRLLESLFRSGCLQRLPAPAPEGKGPLATLADPAATPAAAWQWRRADNSNGLGTQPVWDHLARVWAAREVDQASGSGDHEALAALAARYQLVTPLSGAVVLETQTQYDRHGLTPGDPSASPQIPAVPEPSALLLLLLSTSALALRRQR